MIEKTNPGLTVGVTYYYGGQSMKQILVALLLTGGLLGLMTDSTEAAKVPSLIPREVLFGNPQKAQPRLSPNGQKMAYLAPVNNVLNVWVRTIGKQDDTPITSDTVRGIRQYFWAQDNEHILYMQDAGGNENWRLYGVDINTKETKDWTPFENVQVRIADHDKRFPDIVLLEMNKENPQVHDMYRLNLKTGEMVMIAKNPGSYDGWITDVNQKVLGASQARPDGGFDLLVRDSTEGEFRVAYQWDYEDSAGSGPMGFTLDGKSMYMKDMKDANASRLVKLDLATGGLEVIAEDKIYDCGGVMFHPDSWEVQAVSFERARNEWKVLDPAIAKDFEILQKLNSGEMSIVSRDNADRTWLVAFIQDDQPVCWYVYDRKTRKTEFLFNNRDDLKKYKLASMEPISFTSRDGLTIHGYITFPVGRTRKNLPMVVNVHGGPWVRDSWGYDPEAQWLANRGYICLQVNYRGSTGYGKAFLNAGNKEWAGKMHNDIIDAVNWAVNNKYADPHRVAIYGGSYGGYAALVGATFTPDTFKAAVDIVGPSNLITLIKSVPPYWSTFLANMKRRVGDPDTEEDFLKSRSPLYKVDNIKIPILIGQGANDPRVKQAESEQIVEAMKRKGLDYEYVLFPDEGHGFARPENRLKFYGIAEKFLHKHLNGIYME